MANLFIEKFFVCHKEKKKRKNTFLLQYQFFIVEKFSLKKVSRLFGLCLCKCICKGKL